MRLAQDNMRRFLLISLIVYVAVLTGCSYLTDFAVVNQSNDTIKIRYRIKNHPGPFTTPVPPATVPTSRLNAKHNQDWRELTREAYRLDQETREVVVELGSQEALRIARLHNYERNGENTDADEFPVEEIVVTGKSGELKLVGEQVRLTFSEFSKVLYTLTYR